MKGLKMKSSNWQQFVYRLNLIFFCQFSLRFKLGFYHPLQTKLHWNIEDNLTSPSSFLTCLQLELNFSLMSYWAQTYIFFSYYPSLIIPVNGPSYALSLDILRSLQSKAGDQTTNIYITIYATLQKVKWCYLLYEFNFKENAFFFFNCMSGIY